LAHIVKCSICGKSFDRDKIPCVKTSGRRYAHATCVGELSEEERQRQQDEATFWKYVKEIYGSNYNYMLIKKQVENFQKEYNYTISGMYKTLYWFYVINGGSTSNSNGIGIIPYVYDKAENYFRQQYIIQEKNKTKTVRQPDVRTYIIPSPRNYRLPHLIDIDAIGKGEDNDEE
jgi:hypothetical protein